MEVSIMLYIWKALGIAVLMMSGYAEGVSLAKLKTATTDPSFIYDFTMDITNRIYNNSLLNTDSIDYNMMYEEVSYALYSVYGCPTCDTRSFYQGVTAMTFSNKAGSVVVQATLVFHSRHTNAVVIKSLFLQAIAGRNEINGLKINPEFTQVIYGSAPAPMNVSSTSQPTTTPTTIPTTHPCNPFHLTAQPITCDPFVLSPLTTTPTTTPTSPTFTPTTTPTTTPTSPTFTPTTTPTSPTFTPTTTPTSPTFQVTLRRVYQKSASRFLSFFLPL